jgi:hypothetical protein
MSATIAPAAQDLASHDAADWREASSLAGSLRPIEVVGRYRFARRCIDPPGLDLNPVPDAVRYEILVSPVNDPEAIHQVTGDGPRVDLAPIWSPLPYGPLQLLPRARNGEGRLVGLGALRALTKSPDWDGRPVSPLDYHAAGQGVIDFLVNRTPEAPEHTGMPAYMWHAAIGTARTEMALDCQFPALSYPSLTRLFVTGTAAGCGAALGVDLLARARQLADYLLDHPAVTEGPLAGAPFSTMNQDGTGGMFEPDRLTLVRLGWTGRAMLDLAEATGDPRYTAYAERLGQILLDTQQDDGSWPYRVRLTDAAVVEPYTAASVIALLLLERLETRSPGGVFSEAIERGLAWTLENPVRTGLWQQMYEDVPSPEPYANREQWAALETAMLLLRRRGSDAVPLARSLVRYVEDQFVVFGDDPVFSTPYLPFAPAVLEQYRCYWPMDFHTANYVRAALALSQATGDPAWTHKAIAAANTITRCQGPDGRFSTLVPDRRFGTSPPFSDWFNCMAHAADVLLRLGLELTEASR